MVKRKAGTRTTPAVIISLYTFIGCIMGLVIGFVTSTIEVGFGVGLISGLVIGIGMFYRQNDPNKKSNYEVWLSLRFYIVAFILGVLFNICFGYLFGHDSLIRPFGTAIGVLIAVYATQPKKKRL